ncbi:hypothetical protein OG524_19450 [Streptomyces sp. NBC_01520]|uniref:RipA family octameric membrane protein n=1 Tax=unclassified Streptomyces TaxID=2593676 RepID=UPI001E04A52E|nr:hypothetical protein [Streptomyces sp. HB132]MBM7438105.1 hypothetical protein [Streptomyces sp. HB132]
MTTVHGTMAGGALPAPRSRRTDLRTALWNSAVLAEEFADDSASRYRTAVLEQYKVYVESADRASARRNVANTFFLTVNGLLLTLFGAAAASGVREAPAVGVVCVVVAALCQCVVWWAQARSYRRLGSAKWAVVAELELRLPALAYSSAEWGTALPSRGYTPLTRIEQWVPVVFAALHLGMGLTVLISR